MVYNVMQTESPRYLFSMSPTKYNYDTRHERRALLRPTRESDLELSEDSLRWRAARAFNDLPLPVRNSSSMKTLKIEVKKCYSLGGLNCTFPSRLGGNLGPNYEGEQDIILYFIFDKSYHNLQ
jgi:hypothetical protein